MDTTLSRNDALQAGSTGPVTAARHRRNAWIYGALCVAGLLPTWLALSPALQAAGLGLLVPGGGFLALGPLGVLGLALSLGVFWLSFIVWFWCGMVLAPIAVWLGSALLASALVGETVWGAADHLAALAAVGLYGYARLRASRRAEADRARLAQRQQFFAESLQEVELRVAEEPAPGSRELAPDQIAALRHALDLALQPVGQYEGYTVIDQFQPAALRYQINHLGYLLAMAQCHYTPSFHGYLAQAQRNLIETYLNRRVWDYWVLESMWGHFNFTNFDPAAKDNIMLTGYYGMQVNQYMLVTGDRRYAEPGSLSFQLNERTAYPHSAHTLVDSIRANHARSDFCLFPCEPNWVYPVCNMYGMGALASHDSVFGTDYVQQIAPRWRENLAREFTDGKGSLIGLRSYWTGLEIPFYAGEAGFAFFPNGLGNTDAVETKGYFAGATYDFSDRWSASVEGRYQKDDFRRGTTTFQNVAGSKFLPRVIAQWKPNERTNLYASYALGLLQGEINQLVIDADARERAQFEALGSPGSVPQEELKSYEIGWKQAFNDGRFVLNSALYYGDWANKKIRQVVSVNFTCGDFPQAMGTVGCRPQIGEGALGDPARNPNGSLVFSNQNVVSAYDAKIWGAEFEWAATPTDNLRLGGALTWAKSEMKNGIYNTISQIAGSNVIKGKSNPRFPEWSGSINGEYTAPLTDKWQWFVRGDASYFGKTYVDLDNLASCKGYTIANGGIGASAGNTRVEFFVRNLFDNDSWAACARFLEFDLPQDSAGNPNTYMTVIVAPQMRRQIGLRASYKF